MNVEPDLKSLGTQALQDLLNNLTQAKGFILDQAPELCQQLVARGMYMPLAHAVIALIVVIVCSAIILGGIMLIKKDRDWAEGAPILIIPLVGALFSTFVVFDKACTALSIYIAPKVFLVEEITRMLK